MGRHYEKPPLIEAICEFHFSGESGWDATSPGLIYQEIEKEFPQKTQVTNLSVTIQVNNEDAPAQLARSGITRFSRTDGNALIQIGLNFLAINYVRPYSSWEAFSPLIAQTYDMYRSVVQPQHLNIIALRYINRINFSESNIALEKYFNFYPYIGFGLPQDYTGFVASIQIPYEGERDTLTLNMTPIHDNKTETLGIIFELVYYLAVPEALAMDDAKEWIETAHTRLESVFEASITDALRQTFQERTAS